MPKSSLKPKKRFGQHFLQNEAVLWQICDEIHPLPTDHIVEIGPGLGALTKYLLPHAGQIDVIELDRDVIPELQANCPKLESGSIHQADVLRFDFSSLATVEPLRIVGNLPYNISTPLLFYLLSFRHLVADMHFMLQLEVAERLVAKVGSKDYGRLSVMLQYYHTIELLFTVGADAFYPPPKVNSAVLRFTPIRSPMLPVIDEVIFSDIVKVAFEQRRKIISNSLKKYFTSKQLESLGINPLLRPEQLSGDDFIKLANSLVS